MVIYELIFKKQFIKSNPIRCYILQNVYGLRASKIFEQSLKIVIAIMDWNAFRFDFGRFGSIYSDY